MESFRLERSVEGDLHIEQEETNQNSNQNIELASEAPESAINMVSVTPSSPRGHDAAEYSYTNMVLLNYAQSLWILIRVVVERGKQINIRSKNLTRRIRLVTHQQSLIKLYLEEIYLFVTHVEYHISMLEQRQRQVNVV